MVTALRWAPRLVNCRLYRKQLERQLTRLGHLHRRREGNPLGVKPNESVDDQWIVHGSTPGLQNLQCFVVAQFWPVWAIRRERVETINHGQYSRTDWNRRAY